MEENLDLKSIIEQLQKDNEELRVKLTHLRLQPTWLKLFTWYNVKQVLSNPYFIVGYIVGALFALFFALQFEKGV